MLTVLVKKHPDGYSAHVESIQEILDVLAHDGVGPISLFVFHHPLGHGGDDVIVSVANPDHSISEAAIETQ